MVTGLFNLGGYGFTSALVIVDEEPPQSVTGTVLAKALLGYLIANLTLAQTKLSDSSF